MDTLKIQIPEGFKVESFDEKSGTVKFAPIPKDIKERVKTIDDAIAVLGSDDRNVIDYLQMKLGNLRPHILGNQELIIITKALNEGWKPDWSNSNEWKHFPWFDFNDSSSAGRFSFDSSDLRLSGSIVGSRLCFKSSELAKYAGNQFLEIYRKVHTY